MSIKELAKQLLDEHDKIVQSLEDRISVLQDEVEELENQEDEAAFLRGIAPHLRQLPLTAEQRDYVWNVAGVIV